MEELFNKLNTKFTAYNWNKNSPIAKNETAEQIKSEIIDLLSIPVEKPVILPSDFNWLEASTKFYIERRFVCKALRDIEIVMKRQLNGNAKWAVKCDESFALSKVDGHFDYEPIPSERDDTYLLEHRFDSKEEALQEYRRLVNAETLCIVARSK